MQPVVARSKYGGVLAAHGVSGWLAAALPGVFVGTVCDVEIRSVNGSDADG